MLKVATIVDELTNRLESTVSERDKLAAELASYKHRERIEKLATALIDRDITSDAREQVIARLSNESPDKLASIEAGIDYISPKMNLGELGNPDAGALHPFEAQLLGRRL